MKRYKVKIRYKTKVERYKKRKDIAIKIIVSLAVIIALFFAGSRAVKFLLTSPIFNVKLIEVRGNNIIAESEVLGYIDFNGKNIFQLKIGKVESLLREKFPAIESINIKRRLPDKIAAKIIERVPLVERKIAKKRIGIDEYLKMFVLPQDYKLLPSITKDLALENKKACLEFLKRVSGLPIYKNIKSITANAPDDIIFFLSDNCRVCIGMPVDVDYKITYLERVLADLEVKGERAEYINMRDFSDEYKEIVLRTQ
ncbi:MAG: FtsQ-type POTRA domain-containing protein [Elusimicrobia bacterium]|nr:FtsQ-type POTRA domain-containing protein [Elusimicrobiota bacterium]